MGLLTRFKRRPPAALAASRTYDIVLRTTGTERDDVIVLCRLSSDPEASGSEALGTSDFRRVTRLISEQVTSITDAKVILGERTASAQMVLRTLEDGRPVRDECFLDREYGRHLSHDLSDLVEVATELPLRAAVGMKTVADGSIRVWARTTVIYRSSMRAAARRVFVIERELHETTIPADASTTEAAGVTAEVGMLVEAYNGEATTVHARYEDGGPSEQVLMETAADARARAERLESILRTALADSGVTVNA